MLQRKLFLGARLKRLRRERGLNQSQMAEALGISGSYLNHLERNQRPVTAGILLRLAEAFDVDVKSFAAEAGDGGAATQLGEIFSDPMLADLGVSRVELVELADNAPSVAEGIARLYTAVREVQRRPSGEERRADPRSLITPETWVRDYIQAQRNHYPELEEASETLGGALNHPLSVSEPLRQRLKDAWGVEVRVVDPEILDDASQNYDPQRRQLTLSSLLRSENRTFGIAYQLALLEFAPIIVNMLEVARPPDPGSRRLLHMSFANYAAGAIMMPYGKFLARGRGVPLCARPLDRPVRRQCRAGRASADHAQPAERQGCALLHAPGRSGREHLQALCRRKLPLLAFRRDVPALASAHRVPDPGPDHPTADRDARRPALFHHQPDHRAADPARPQ